MTKADFTTRVSGVVPSVPLPLMTGGGAAKPPSPSFIANNTTSLVSRPTSIPFKSIAAQSGFLGVLRSLPQDIAVLPFVQQQSSGLENITGAPVILANSGAFSTPPFKTYVFTMGQLAVKGYPLLSSAIDGSGTITSLKPDIRFSFELSVPPVGVEASDFNGGYLLFALSTATELSVSDGAGTVQNLSALPSKPVLKNAAPAVSSNGKDKVHVYAVADTGLAHIHASGSGASTWGAWQVEAVTSSLKPQSPSVTRVSYKDALGVVQVCDLVLAVTTTDKVVYNIRNKATGKWTGWNDLPNDVVLGTPLTTKQSPQAFLENASGRRGFFVISSAGRVYEVSVAVVLGSLRLTSPVPVTGGGSTVERAVGYGISGGSTPPRVLLTESPGNLFHVNTASSATADFPVGGYLYGSDRMSGVDSGTSTIPCVATLQKSSGRYYLTFCQSPRDLTVIPVQ